MTILRNFMKGLAVTAALAIGGMAQAAENPLLEKYKAEGVKVGIAGYAPYGYKQPDGSFTGEQVEIVKYVLGQMGVTKLEFIAMDFGALIPSMVAGRIDMGAAGIYVRPKRCEQVLFAEPTWGQGAAYIVKKGNPKKLHTFTDIKNTDGAILAVLAGGTEETLAKKDGVPDDKLMKVGDKAAGISAVIAGRADGSIAFRKGSGDELKANMAFRDAFQVELKKWMDSGGYQQMASAWGFGPKDAPSKTMKELCGEGL